MKRLAHLTRVFVLGSAIAFTLPLMAAPEHGGEAASHGEGHGGGDPLLKWKFINFGILAAIFGFLAYKHGGAFFSSRTKDIQRGLSEAAKLKEEAEIRYSEMDKRLNSLDAEIQNLRKQAGDESNAENERMRAATGRDIEKVKAQAEQDISSAAKSARQQLRAYAAEVAVGIAEQKIRQQLTQDADGKLVESMMKELGNQFPNQPGRPS